ncbi:MAG: phosphatase PAP2 family protein [Actinomycetota bacterium]|nr:phosphatase PAP2 family protein [Actinomycetota bacterium]
MLLDRRRTEQVLLALVVAENAWSAAGAAAMLLDGDRRRAWARANAAMSAAWAATKLLSRTTKRSRPHFCDCPPARPKDDRESFPSSHAATSFAAAVAVPPLLPAAPLFAAATATATARLLLGEHYPSDVAGGMLLGSVVAALVGRRRRPLTR